MVVSIHVKDLLREYILDLVKATRENIRFQLGVSPRGALALYRGAQSLAAIRGRDYVTPEDVKELVVPVFSKRVILKSDSLIRGITTESVLKDVIESVDVPGLKDLKHSG